MRLNAISYAAIQKAVTDVLATNNWPIHRTYDDAGLEEEEYVIFVAEVITKIRHNSEGADQQSGERSK